MAAPVPEWLKPISVKNKIRLGKNSDGGYVVTENTVTAAKALAGLGVATDWTFEEDFFSRKCGGFPVHCYDDRVTPIRFLEISVAGLVGYLLPTRKTKRPRLHVYPSYVRFFVLNRAVSLQNATVGIGDRAIGIPEILSRFDEEENVFLKMDIEGSEYELLPDTINYRHRLVGAVIEFHECAANLPLIANFVDAISDLFWLTHIHANNAGGVGECGMPNVLELTFERIALVERTSESVIYPVEGIDFPNNSTLPELELEFVVDDAWSRRLIEAAAMPRISAP